MTGRVDVSDGELVDVVAAGEPEMLELLARLLAAPTTLGNEEPGPLDEELLRSHPLAVLQPLFYVLDYAHAMGTLYTAFCRPRRGSLEHRWPGLHWEHSFNRFREGARTVKLLQASAA